MFKTQKHHFINPVMCKETGPILVAKSLASLTFLRSISSDNTKQKLADRSPINNVRENIFTPKENFLSLL